LKRRLTRRSRTWYNQRAKVADEVEEEEKEDTEEVIDEVVEPMLSRK
jgi:hypothetical protein